MIDRDKQLVALADEMGKAGGAARVPPVWIDRLRAILAAPSPSREELREAVVKIIQGGVRANDASTTITDRILALLPASRDEGMQEAFVAGGTFLVDPSLRFAVEDKLIAEAKRRYAKGRDA